MHAAARGGNLEALQLLPMHDCPWDMRTCTLRALGGSTVGAGTRLPVELVEVCHRFPEPLRD